MMSSEKPLLYNAIKSYNMDQGEYEFTDQELVKCANKVYDHLLFRIEQLGYFEIKNREIAALSVHFILPELLELDLTHNETVALARKLLGDLNAE